MNTLIVAGIIGLIIVGCILSYGFGLFVLAAILIVGSILPER